MVTESLSIDPSCSPSLRSFGIIAQKSGNYYNNQKVKSDPLKSVVHQKRVQLAWSGPCTSSPTDECSSFDAQKQERYISTGTTIGCICGVVFCVLVDDTRSKVGSSVADKCCRKLHKLSSNCAADLDHLTRECYYTAKLIRQTQEQYGNER
jgi:hypothetical protein